MHSPPLLRWTAIGLYCQAGDFYIDPVRPVKRAIITHAHSDHARMGMRQYITHNDTLPILRLRLGSDISVVGLSYGETRSINGVHISLHPAGHIIGSAQVRVNYGGEVWVVSGDYHTIASSYCTPFEPIPCHTFITESTFGHPTFEWAEESSLYQEIKHWIGTNRQNGDASVLIAYALGKAQRLLCALTPDEKNIYVHNSIQTIQDCLQPHHPHLPLSTRITSQTKASQLEGQIIIAPPGILKGNWMQKLPRHKSAYMTGWAQDAQRSSNLSTATAFALSDHADFGGLVKAVQATGASRVLTYHGYDVSFASHLSSLGIESSALHPNHTPTLF